MVRGLCQAFGKGYGLGYGKGYSQGKVTITVTLTLTLTPTPNHNPNLLSADTTVRGQCRASWKVPRTISDSFVKLV